MAYKEDVVLTLTSDEIKSGTIDKAWSYKSLSSTVSLCFHHLRVAGTGSRRNDSITFEYQVIGTLHYITYITLRYITLHYVTFRCITLHHVTLRYIALHRVTLRYVSLHCVILRYITLHYVLLCYGALRCNA